MIRVTEKNIKYLINLYNLIKLTNHRIPYTAINLSIMTALIPTYFEENSKYLYILSIYGARHKKFFRA